MSNKVIKVLHIGLSSNIGGIENVVRSWNKNLPTNIHFDFINNQGQPIAFEDEFIENGSRIYNIVSRRKNPIQSYDQLKKIIIENKYDYIHHHMMSFSWPQPLKIAADYPYTNAIAHSHTAGFGNLSAKYNFLDKLGRRMLANSNYYKIACGDAAGQSMFHTDDYIVIRNGVEFSKFRFSKESRKRIRNKHNILDDTFVIGHVGRNDSAKNYPFILELFEKFNRERSNSILLLIGDIKNNKEIRDIIIEKKLEKKIIFTGPLSNTADYYSAMDVFILPSLYEGVSVAMVEAQVSGLHCIVSNFVSKEADISGNVKYIAIDNFKDGVQKLLKEYQQNYKRNDSSIVLDNSYDACNTSDSMFEFYKSHLIKRHILSHNA